MERLNLPYDLQRRADIVRELLKELKREVQRRVEINYTELEDIQKQLHTLTLKAIQEERHKKLVEAFIWDSIYRISLTVQFVEIELSKRINAKLSKDFAEVYTREHLNRELKLSKQVAEFVNDVLRVAPEIEKLLRIGKDEFGFTDEDLQQWKESVAFLEHLRRLGYV